MVKAQEYLDTNYPKGAVREGVEGELDLSNKNLTGWLNFGGFTNVQKLNFSFNEIAGLGFGYGEKKLEVLDVSHNRLGPTIGGFSYSLKFVNFSNNFYSEVSLGMISLTHLDVSNNALTSLWIKSSGNLTELKCWGNPLLTNLTLAPNLDPNSLSLSDCPALSLLKPTSTASSSSLLPPPTFQPKNDNGLSISDKIALGTGVGLGVPALALTALGTWVGYKQLKIAWREYYKENKERKRTMQTEAELNELGEGTSLTIMEGMANNQTGQQRFETQTEGEKDENSVSNDQERKLMEEGFGAIINIEDKEGRQKIEEKFQKSLNESKKETDTLKKKNDDELKEKEVVVIKERQENKIKSSRLREEVRTPNQEDAWNNWEMTLTDKKPILERVIGKGGYGEVWYGKWGLQEVAVKKLYLSLSNISELDLKDIKREIDILKNLRDRYIIQYYGTYSDNQELLIIMDYAENGPLTKFINDNKHREHNWELSTNFIKQMALGLAYIHSQKVIHRDLKSMNILLTNYYQVKISDFGLSKAKNISSSFSSKHSAVGTLKWMAPELLRDIKNPKYSECSDIYALGMIMWEIVAKCTIPFKDVDCNLIALHIVNNGKETIPDDTPEKIKGIIEQCWKDVPNERITLERILEIIETDKSEPQTISGDGKSLDTENLSKSQNNEEISKEFYASKSLKIDFADFTSLNKEENESDEKIQLYPSMQTQIEQPPK